MAAGDDQPGDHDGSVALSLPADPRHLRLARLTASGFSADLGFSLDEVEELRLAVGEASALLVEHAAAGARLTVRYHDDDGELVVEGRCPADADSPITVDPVAEAVLVNTVDTFEVDRDGEANRFRLAKRARA
jgi:serine/threonine-protein kinase RsbW